MLSETSIKEYQRILAATCGIELTDAEAQSSAEALVSLYRAVYEPKDSLEPET